MMARRLTAFTLIEMLVVLFIIGTLLSLIAPQVLSRPDQARALKVKSDLVNLQSALILYRMDTAKYPDTNSGLKALLGEDGRSYLAKIERDPWGSEYQYRVEQDGARIIYSMGPDTIDDYGQKDDIKLQLE